jgi:hypothetical protein
MQEQDQTEGRSFIEMRKILKYGIMTKEQFFEGLKKHG